MSPARFAILLLAGLAALLGASPAASGQDVILEAEIGWGGRYRPDRWTPARVQLQARDPMPALLRWYVPRPGREAMVIEQSVVINPRSGTFQTYLPIGPDPAGVHLTVVSQATGRTLAHWPTGLVSPIEYADVQVRTPVFVGVSGAGPALGFLDQGHFAVSFLEVADLPRRAIGYDGLDVLALNRPQLAQIDLEQQVAIVAWVRAGGRLVMWLDLQPLPEDSPLMSLLPGGGLEAFEEREVNGQPVMYARLRGAGNGELVTRTAMGAGEVVFIHVPAEIANAAGADFMPREPRTERLPLELLPEDVELAADAAHGKDRRLLIPLLAIAVIIGPVDWFVLHRTRRRMRRWITLPGWLAIFGLLIWYLPTAPLPQTAVVVEAHGLETPPFARATAATTSGRLEPGEHDELQALQTLGRPYWRTLGFDRTRGALRDIVFVQGDDGMAAGRPGEAGPAFVAEGMVVAE